MHKTIAANLTADLKAAISALDNNPSAMRKIFNEIHKVLWSTFKTKIFLITPGCATCEYTLVDKAYEEATEKIKFEFRQAYKYFHWDYLDENLFRQALDRLIYNIHGSLTFETPAEVYIYRSEPGSNPSCSYVTRWAGEARYGLYVKVVQIDGSAREFDLLDVYRSLEKI
jgi:hypothetical protein